MLFGYIKGAFTGADREKTGLLDEANEGFLFLDEVHRLSAENQEKLFLFMDKGYFHRLGGESRPTSGPYSLYLLHHRKYRSRIIKHLPTSHSDQGGTSQLRLPPIDRKSRAGGGFLSARSPMP